MAQTGRLLADVDLAPLLLAPARPASVSWRLDHNGRQRPCFKPEPFASLVVMLQPPWYIDLDEGLVDPAGSAGQSGGHCALVRAAATVSR